MPSKGAAPLHDLLERLGRGGPVFRVRFIEQGVDEDLGVARAHQNAHVGHVGQRERALGPSRRTKGPGRRRPGPAACPEHQQDRHPEASCHGFSVVFIGLVPLLFLFKEPRIESPDVVLRDLVRGVGEVHQEMSHLPSRFSSTPVQKVSFQPVGLPFHSASRRESMTTRRRRPPATRRCACPGSRTSSAEVGITPELGVFLDTLQPHRGLGKQLKMNKSSGHRRNRPKSLSWPSRCYSDGLFD